MYYYGARYYDPKIGVWLSVDPLASKYPYVSPYNFVEGNPINLVDPTGLGPGDPNGNPVSTREISTLRYVESTTKDGAGTGNGVDHLQHSTVTTSSRLNEEGKYVTTTNTINFNVQIDEKGEIDKSNVTMNVTSVTAISTEDGKERNTTTQDSRNVEIDYNDIPDKFRAITEKVAKAKSASGRSEAQKWAHRSNIAIGTGTGVVVGLATGGTGLALPLWGQVATGAGASVITSASVDVNPEIFRFTLYDSGFKRD